MPSKAVIPEETVREHVSNVIEMLKAVRQSPVAPAEPASFDGYWVDRTTFETIEGRLRRASEQLKLVA